MIRSFPFPTEWSRYFVVQSFKRRRMGAHQQKSMVRITIGGASLAQLFKIKLD